MHSQHYGFGGAVTVLCGLMGAVIGRHFGVDFVDSISYGLFFGLILIVLPIVIFAYVTVRRLIKIIRDEQKVQSDRKLSQKSLDIYK